MHSVILECTDVATAIGPLQSAEFVDEVPQEAAGVHATARPTLRALAGRAVVLESPDDGGPGREAVATGAGDLVSVPEPLELCAIAPVEDAMPVELAVAEHAFKPRAVGEDLQPSALRTMPLEGPLVERTIRPRLSPCAFRNAIHPFPEVGGAVCPLHPAFAVQTPMQPLPLEGLATGLLVEPPDALHLPLRELADVAIPIRPATLALTVQGVCLESAFKHLAGRTHQLAATPHHVLLPLPDVRSSVRPSPLAAAMHGALVELAPILPAIRGPVEALALASHLRPTPQLGVGPGMRPGGEHRAPGAAKPGLTACRLRAPSPPRRQHWHRRRHMGCAPT
mmetsp:Transcript_87752/g.223345  ORF Transcript_87752/g.223345 Transcript_87752/m.223345 type:complete len:338 (+) Transcript_87752:903-1916(+)